MNALDLRAWDRMLHMVQLPEVADRSRHPKAMRVQQQDSCFDPATAQSDKLSGRKEALRHRSVTEAYFTGGRPRTRHTIDDRLTLDETENHVGAVTAPVRNRSLCIVDVPNDSGLRGHVRFPSKERIIQPGARSSGVPPRAPTMGRRRTIQEERVAPASMKTEVHG